jgi:hypothetical protein
MLWLPDASEELLNVAVPALFREPVPSVVVPSINVTMPVGAVGVDEPGATTVTVAVSATVWPTLEGLGDAASVVVVAAWFTVWFNTLEVPEAKMLSPEYEAVMLWLPTTSAALLSVPMPLLRDALPNTIPPSLNVTVPVGTLGLDAVGVTVAVKLTCCPNTDGFMEEARDVVVDAPVLFTVVVAELVLFEAFGYSTETASAVFVMTVPGAQFAVTRIVIRAAVPPASEPMLHVIVPAPEQLP